MKKKHLVLIKVCPHCGNEITHKVLFGKEYACKYCRREYTKETIIKVKP